MADGVSRYLGRFSARAVLLTLFVVLLVPAVRAVYVARVALPAARRALAAEAPAQALGTLARVAHWSMAFPVLDAEVRQLARQAVAQGALQTPRRPEPGALDVFFTAGEWLVNRVLALTVPVPPAWAQAVVLAAPDGSDMSDTSDGVGNVHSRSASLPPAAPRRVPPSARLNLPRATDAAAPAVAGATPEGEAAVAMPAVVERPEMYWGVVTALEAAVYDLHGRRVQTAPAGSLVDVAQLVSSSEGEIVRGTVHARAGRFSDVLLRRADTEIYTGIALHETTLERRRLASRRAELMGAIVQRRQQVVAAGANRNPHQQPLLDLLRQYRALAQEAETLQAQYEKETGAPRMRSGNRLRELKNEQAVLTPQYQALRAQRDAWEAEHGGPPPDPEQDETLQALRQQLAEAEAAWHRELNGQ